MNEVYKCLNGLSPDIMNDILAVSKHRYNTRHYNLFVTDRAKILNFVLYSSKHEELAFTYAFIFAIIQYFIGVILLKNVTKRGGVGKKRCKGGIAI